MHERFCSSTIRGQSDLKKTHATFCPLVILLREGSHRFERVKTKRRHFYQSGKDRKEDSRLTVCADKFTFQVIQVREQVFDIRTTSEEEEDYARFYYFSFVDPRRFPLDSAAFAFVSLSFVRVSTQQRVSIPRHEHFETPSLTNEFHDFFRVSLFPSMVETFYYY